MSIVEMTLPEGSPSIGKAIYELRMPTDSAVVAILRDGHVVIPQPESVLVAGDEVIALASAPSERALRDVIIGDMPGSVPDDPLDGGASIS